MADTNSGALTTTDGGYPCGICGQTRWHWAAHFCQISPMQPASAYINLQPNYGWSCRKCGRSYAPWMPQCDVCNRAVAAAEVPSDA